ncbi:hypothetical protein ACNO8S_16200 (plasmid) [Haloarcula sp. KBTZ06]|uniref:hypothetical protein n=1 Tax=Haloarcula sp. KBTZ06 TaxID=3402682 RepID=UPI003B428002
MATTDAPDSAGTDTAPAQANPWRLRYMVGDLEHYTEWTTDFPTIENYYDQYRRGDYAHDVAIERRTVVKR